MSLGLAHGLEDRLPFGTECHYSSAMTLAGLLQRKPKDAQVVLVPESHAGQNGYSVFRDGRRVAWGRTETAAVAAYGVVSAA